MGGETTTVDEILEIEPAKRIGIEAQGQAADGGHAAGTGHGHVHGMYAVTVELGAELIAGAGAVELLL